MKKMIKSASNTGVTVKVIAGKNMNSEEPSLITISVRGDDYKEVLMDISDNQLALPYLGLDFNEPDEFTAEELLEAIVNNNGAEADMDYIFLLQVNGEDVINNIARPVSYRI